MRLFIAVNFNNDTRSRLLALRDELRSRSQRGNFSAPENLHLTLAFLGECEARQITAAKSVLGEISFEPFNIVIDCVGRWGRGGGDTWWAGMHESKPLINLQRDLTDRLISAGFELDRRKYSPHITLSREVVTDYVLGRVEPFGETVSAIELMKSERTGGKLKYSAIARNKL